MKQGIHILLFFMSSLALAQSADLLPRNINPVDYNSVYPSVSGDGKVMVFMTDYSDDGSFAMVLSKYRAGKWTNPEDLQVLGSSTVNNWGGYNLNYDGSTIYFSSRRSNGVGAFDIWYSTLENDEWSRPTNFGKPVNTDGNEGNPSISADNQRIYFMRCDKMSTSDASGCKLYYSEKGPRGWGDAIAMPDYVNVGNTTSPRILPDNRTLVFASDRPGGKGGIDIWMTKRTGDHWSAPVNLSAVNTDGNDLFLSVTLRSLAFYTTMSETGKKAIAQTRLPDAFRVENVIVQQGAIKDKDGNPLAADVRAYNLNEQTYEGGMRTSIADGNFVLILPEGAKYDVSFNEVRLSKLYQSELVDATELIAPRREYPNIVLADLNANTIFPLMVFKFKPYSSEIDDISTQELARLTRLLSHYPALDIEVGGYQKKYIEDTEAVNPDLTEQRIDSTYTKVAPLRTENMATADKDSLLTLLNNELSAIVEDTLTSNIYLQRMAALDSVTVLKLVNVYHNDRTAAQADAVKSKLVDGGINEQRIKTKGYKAQKPPVEFPYDEDRVIVIRFLDNPQE